MDFEKNTLYNKYRPKQFKDLIGQENVKIVLKNILTKPYIHHGIILTGIRGVGKTSASSIFASGINCLKVHDLLNNKNDDVNQEIELEYIPCGVCDNCKISMNGCDDIIYIDGATNTGVDSMREIIQDSMFLPKYLKYKVIIIDEVHMLSKSAFNSILMTLEKPPKTVKFIFSTTEEYKIPDTIISRCLFLKLNNITQKIMYEFLKNVAVKENINISDDGLMEICYRSEGSIRDGLSILEHMALLFEKKNIITLDLIENTFKILKYKDVIDIYKKCLEGKWLDASKDWHFFYEKGFSSLDFLRSLSTIICYLCKLKYLLENQIGKEFFFSIKKIKENDLQNIEQILLDFDISNNILIGHWEICLFGIRNVNNGEEFLVDMILLMISVMEDNLPLEEIEKFFPGIRLI